MPESAATGLVVPPAAWLAAAASAVLAALAAWRGLRNGPAGFAAPAAIVRGLAVLFAVVAAFAPVARSVQPVAGRTLVAAPRDAVLDPADAVVRWPSDAPDAAAALETLRAARDADSPASLALAVGGDAGRARDLAPAARALRAADAVDRFVVALTSREPPGPRGPAPRILAPAGATEGVPLVLVLDAGAVPFAAGEARVEAGGHVARVALPSGARRVATPPLSVAAGTHVVVAEVPARAAAAEIVEVAGPPRVLVLSLGAGPHEIVAMLRAQGLDASDVAEAELRTEDVESCAAIVLGAGVGGETLAAAVASRVRRGAGLLVLGGEGTLGISRLRGTAIDALLPVVPPPPPVPPPEPPVPPPPARRPDPARPAPSLDEGDKEALRVALLLVIDTSGSMAGAKLLMAQQSAVAAASSLAPADRVGVFAFDDDAREVVPFQDAVEMQALFRRVAALSADGGTNFFPALKAGYGRILEQPCGIRHVILLTDGETRPAVFRELVERGAAQGVTLSTVAVGDGADTNLLALLAGWGRGKLYLARDPARLPEIVTLDTRRFSTGPRDRAKGDRPSVDSGELPEPPGGAAPQGRGAPGPGPRDAAPAMRPHAASAAAFLAGLESERWPALPFPETTPARSASQVVLAWDEGSPALTLGRAGLGRVAVISADPVCPDAGEFRRWREAPRVLAQLVRGLAANSARGAEPLHVELVESDGGRAFARIAVAGGGALALDPLRAGAGVAASCDDRAGSSVAEMPAMLAAGVYAGTFTAKGAAPRRAVAVSPGPRAAAPHAAAAIARASGAAVVERIPRPSDGAPVEREDPREFAFVAAAAALLVAEAALRRFARRPA